MADPLEPKESVASSREHIDLVVSDLHANSGTSPSSPSTDDSEEIDALIGTTIADKYEINAFVGRGGMGAVYRATHIELNRVVAVKVLHKHLLSHQGISERFRLSAQAAHALRHANLVSVTDFGFTTEGQFYLTMDYISGETLADRIRRERELSVDSFFKIFSQVLSGLRFCHQKGIVHRDIKPSNILLTDREIRADSVKLVDFGIAKVLPDAESSIDHLTQTGELLGSPLYMSPEQCRGDEIDERTDLYSLGCVMYEALSGKPPYQGKSAIQTLMMQCSEPAPTLPDGTAEDQHLTEQLDAFIKKALRKSPADRFNGSEEMESALASIQRFLHLPKIARHRLTSPQAPGTDQPLKGQTPKQSNNRAVMLATGLGLAGLLLYIGSGSIHFGTEQPALLPTSSTPQEHALDSIKLGVVERSEGNLTGSNSRLNKALILADAAFGKDSKQYITALKELASTEIALAQNQPQERDLRYANAEQHLLATMKLIGHVTSKAQVKDEDLSELKLLEANTTFHLADLYTKRGLLSQAGPWYSTGFTLIGTDQPGEEAYEEYFRSYADFLWAAGNYREAAALEVKLALGAGEASQQIELPARPLSGDWIADDNFSLRLNDNSGTVSGSHHVIAKHGKRIDGQLDNSKPTITATISNGMCTGTVQSTFGLKSKFTLVPVGNLLVWKIVGSENEGESFLPTQAILRQSTAAFVKQP